MGQHEGCQRIPKKNLKSDGRCFGDGKDTPDTKQLKNHVFLLRFDHTSNLLLKKKKWHEKAIFPVLQKLTHMYIEEFHRNYRCPACLRQCKDNWEKFTLGLFILRSKRIDNNTNDMWSQRAFWKFLLLLQGVCSWCATPASWREPWRCRPPCRGSGRHSWSCSGTASASPWRTHLRMRTCGLWTFEHVQTVKLTRELET